MWKNLRHTNTKNSKYYYIFIMTYPFDIISSLNLVAHTPCEEFVLFIPGLIKYPHGFHI